MHLDADEDSYPDYYPNSFGGPEPTFESQSRPKTGGNVPTNTNPTHVQATISFNGNLGKVMTDRDRKRSVDNIVSRQCNANKEIQIQQSFLCKANSECECRIAKGLR
jgi:catalase